ncbi:UbiX family flavin prenyltransferase [Luteithermobacter gelatinilyticus]|uniref:UbiX family flavin prenyltransferase n=1 Tax=Luteithermobacter gelatinilyticus TaxID=2582913 RepID=UPI001106266D|nr:UbiX family flavin prenyltransferase [Luteithermobacter gelatinilyticus]|tara:strand:- start:43 stop:621 length:579 start_codon:yes stop_codon:yes gene_type:complete
MKLIIGIAGASGVIYGIRLLEALRQMKQVESHLVMTATARMNIGLETDYTPRAVEALADVVHKNGNLAASIASGSFRADGMIVAACSMKTLSAIVHSHADDLLTRAADVILKERRRLVLMPRETPLHTGHCRLLYEASQMGAVIAPPSPAFYIRPRSLEDVIDHAVGRILDLFDLDCGLVRRWQGPPASPET